MAGAHPIRLEFLGSGTSTGVPTINCNCKTCTSAHPRNQRLRASVWIQTQGKSFLVDTSTDLRQQALRAGIHDIDAVLFTHPHADHVSGIDELRCYSFRSKKIIPLYAHDWTADDLTSRFPYLFNNIKVEGAPIPQVSLRRFNPSETIEFEGIPITPISVQHGSREVVGYRIDSVAYVTDCSYIPPESLEKLKGLSILGLDCVRFRQHPTHFNLDAALEVVEKIKPERTYLTHLGCDIEYEECSKKLPKGVFLAYDGLSVESNA